MLKIKTFETFFHLKDLYDPITSLIDKRYNIIENSYASNSKLFITGIDLRTETIIIRGSVDELTKRTYMSITALKTSNLLKFLNLDEDPKISINSVGNTLFKFISNQEKEEEFSNPFIGLCLKRKDLAVNDNNLIRIEHTILNKISALMRDKFGCSDDLMKFPFSLTNIDGKWELWEDIYHNFILAIINNFVAGKNSSIKVYKYYDFAPEEEIYQRICDCVIAEEKEMTFSPVSVSTGIVPKKWDDQSQRKKEEIKQQNKVGMQKAHLKKIEPDNKEYGTHYLWLSFVFTNRTLKPMSIIQVLKLIQEVKMYAQKFRDTTAKYIEITPSIVLLSLFGYDQNVARYLRENIFRDRLNIIPMFVMPPINNDLWHNLIIKDHITKRDEFKLQESKRVLDVYNKITGQSSLKKAKVQSAENQYEHLKASEKNMYIDNSFLKRWAEILSLSNSNELLDATKNQTIIRNAIATFNE